MKYLPASAIRTPARPHFSSFSSSHLLLNLFQIFTSMVQFHPSVVRSGADLGEFSIRFFIACIDFVLINIGFSVLCFSDQSGIQISGFG
jgi:hypothetical protein